jgi:hypothetical protein
LRLYTKDVTQLVVCCTEYEAGRLGKFLNETLEQLLRWKSDKVGRCRLPASKPVLTAPMVSALEAII